MRTAVVGRSQKMQLAPFQWLLPNWVLSMKKLVSLISFQTVRPRIAERHGRSNTRPVQQTYILFRPEQLLYFFAMIYGSTSRLASPEPFIAIFGGRGPSS